MSDKDILEEAQLAFTQCEAHESDNRQAARDDIRFARLGEQWDPELKARRLREGRPTLTINKLPPFIRQVVNDARQNKPAIKVQPQDSKADPATAEVMGDLIRNIEQTSDAEVAYDTALEGAASNGFGYFRINLDYASDDTFEQDIRIERVANPFTIYGDPTSQAADSSDWNLAFALEMIPEEEFKRRFQGADETDFSTLKWPTGWRDGKKILTGEYWKREPSKRQIVLLSNGDIVDLEEFETNLAQFQADGITVEGSPRPVNSHKVTQYLLTGREVLEKIDWAGRYIPIVPVYGDEVNFEGKRYFRSLIRDAKDAQVMHNAWRSLTTELVALAPKAPWIGKVGAFETDLDKWETANSAPHSYLEYDGDTPPQRQPFAGVPAGALQEALNASDDMKAIIGIYDASLGARSNETSGRAIMARQREGDVSTFHFQDNLTRAIRHAGRILVDLIPEVYSTERMVRVMGQDGTARNVNINTAQPVEQPSGKAEEDAILATYNLALGKYDVTVSAGPSFTTRREEAAVQMTELIRAYPAAAPILGDLLAKNLDWPGADEIAERMKAMLPPQARGADAQLEQVRQEAGQAIQKVGQQAQQLAQENAALKAQLQAAQGEQEIKNRELDLKARELALKEAEAAFRMQQPTQVRSNQPEFT